MRPTADAAAKAGEQDQGEVGQRKEENKNKRRKTE